MDGRGTIGEILKCEDRDRFFWKFHGLASSFEMMGDFYWSPEIQHLDNVWKLRFYPGGTYLIPGPVVFQVWRRNVGCAKSVRISLGFRRLDGSEEAVCDKSFDSDTSVRSSLSRFMRCDNWNELAIEGISFRIYIGEPASMEGMDLGLAQWKIIKLTTGQVDWSHNDRIGRKLVPGQLKRKNNLTAEQQEWLHSDPIGADSTLRQHLENMLLCADDHDVTIQVEDKQFKAHKNVLRTRSPVFSAMFQHKMKESAENSISIDDCDPESFGEFLRYVYTERVKDLSLGNAMGLYYAGDKYDFKGLKTMCVEFLKASLSTAVIGDVISLAMRHNESELLEDAMAFFSLNLVEVMSSEEWRRFLLNNPIQANEACLKAVKCRLGEDF